MQQQGLTELVWSDLKRLDILLFLKRVSEPLRGPSTAKMPLDGLSPRSLNKTLPLLEISAASALVSWARLLNDRQYLQSHTVRAIKKAARDGNNQQGHAWTICKQQHGLR